MVTVNYKFINLCSGGEHGQLDLTPGPTVNVNVSDFNQLLNEFAALSNKEKALRLLALHADANGLTLAQLKGELVAASGLDLTI